jgi:hypothetical protein
VAVSAGWLIGIGVGAGKNKGGDVGELVGVAVCCSGATIGTCVADASGFAGLGVFVGVGVTV